MKATISRAVSALLGLCVWMLVSKVAVAAEPVHRWLFDDASGTIAADSGSGSPANGTLGPAAAWAANGDGAAVGLSGVSGSKVDFPATVGAFGTADFTVAFEVSGSFFQGERCDLVGNRSSGSHGNFFQIRMHGPASPYHPSGTVTAEIDQDGGGTNYIVAEGGAINDGAKHHVAVVRAGNKLSLAIDGHIVATSTGAGIANVNGANPFRIGRSVADGVYPASQFHPVGKFDDLLIFDRALGTREISELAGNADPSIAFGANEALAARFAPKLVFDTDATTFPMSAEPFKSSLDQTGQIIENIDEATLSTGEVPTYYQIRECGTDQIRIKYWWFYGHQEMCADVSGIGDIVGPIDSIEEHLGAHNGDWESVMVTLSHDRTKVAAVTYWAHGDYYTRLAEKDGFDSDGPHPIVYVGRTAHGSYHETGGNDVEACRFWSDSRSEGPTMATWNNLVSLDGDEEEWMEEDREGGFSWGPDGVSTHPTQSPPTCDMNAADWTPTLPGSGGLEVLPPWETAQGGSQCKVGDEDDPTGLQCVEPCPQGWTTTVNFLCINYQEVCTPNCALKLFGSCIIPLPPICATVPVAIQPVNLYGHDYDLPASDADLLVNGNNWSSPPEFTARRPLGVALPFNFFNDIPGGVYGVSASHGLTKRSWTGSAWTTQVATYPATALVPGSVVPYSLGNPSSLPFVYGVTTSQTVTAFLPFNNLAVIDDASYNPGGNIVPGSVMMNRDVGRWFGVAPSGQIRVWPNPQTVGSNVIPGSLVADYNHGDAVVGVRTDGQLVVAYTNGSGGYHFGLPGFGNLVAGSLVPVAKEGAAGGFYGVTQQGHIARAKYVNGWQFASFAQESPVVGGSLISTDGHVSGLLGVNARGRVIATNVANGNVTTAEIPGVSGIVPGSLAYAGPTAGVVGVDRDGKLVRLWLANGAWQSAPVGGTYKAVFPLTMTPGSEYTGDGSVYALDRNGRMIYTSFDGSTLVAATVADVDVAALDPERDCNDDCPLFIGECAPGEQESCYSGLQGTAGVGSCAAGTRTCDASGEWGPCVGEQLPQIELCSEGVDNDCDGAIDETAVTIGQVYLDGPYGGPVSLEVSGPLSFDTNEAASFTFAGNADDITILASAADPPTFSLVGSVVTLTLPSSYILFQDNVGYFGFEGDLVVQDGNGNSFTRSGWDETHVTHLTGFPSRPFGAPVLKSELAERGWVDAGGLASLRLYLFTDSGFVDVTVNGDLCQPDNGCNGGEVSAVTIGQVALESDPSSPVSLQASGPMAFDTNANASFSFANGAADDFAILASPADPPTMSLVGSVATLTLPSSYVLFQDTVGHFGFNGDLVVHDGNGHSFTRVGAGETHVTHLAGFPSRPFTTPVLSSELADLGWVDADGLASLQMYLFTDIGGLVVTVQGLQCQ